MAKTTAAAAVAATTAAASNGKAGDSNNKKPAVLNPRSNTFEFGGLWFTPFIFLLSYPMAAFLFAGCELDGTATVAEGGNVNALDAGSLYCPTLSAAQWKLFFETKFFDASYWFDLQVFGIYCAWFVWLTLLYYIVPASYAEGTLLRNGKRLQYPLNALSSLFVTLAALAGATYHYGLDPLLYVYDHYLHLLTASWVFATLQAIFVYLYSFRRKDSDGEEPLLALGGNTGYAFYDFFIGRELNPRYFSGTFDVKYFCELRPGIIGWIVLNIAIMAKQYSALGYVTNALALSAGFQIVYAIDSLVFESTILPMMDIVTDGFGFMLSFGDLTWVPFGYSFQPRFLSMQPINLSPFAFWSILALFIVGFSLFRLANLQKNIFRADPDHWFVRDLKFIKTESGSKLLVTGLWGVARKINYTGDWLLAFAWCLPCLFTSVMPYIHVIYFLLLLIHREIRDATKCEEKYGRDWKRYTMMVPYRFIPYIY
ncbi:hypothetical protein GQ42DRAFT_180075 [Ramicandelaber brevisporus]|nr:hypothetical protein GQ42DRAFT_180075 [Ramicandelaber brevisporus]